MPCSQCESDKRLAEAREQAGAVTIYRIEVLPSRAVATFLQSLVGLVCASALVHYTNDTILEWFSFVFFLTYALYFFVPACRVAGMVLTKRSTQR